MEKSTTLRRPAKIVKCPYCDWKGSARGLFSHSRLMHNKKINDAKEIKTNPYAVNKPKKVKSSISGVNDSMTIENALIVLGAVIVGKWILNEIDNRTFQSECKKLKLDASKIRIASQNIESPQRPTTTPPLK
jgi:hypothetical protein